MMARGHKVLVEIVRHGPKPRTRTRGLRERAWWVIRARRVVSVLDLLAALSDGSESDARGNLQRYLRALELAGFLARVQPTAGVRRYRLVRDSGRVAPVVRSRWGMVYDPNTGVAYRLSPEQGEGDEQLEDRA